MEIQTTRFGRISVDDQHILTFRHGLLGFPDLTRYALLEGGQEDNFFWLQSVEDGELAFVVANPAQFFKNYEVPFREEIRQELALSDVAFARIFVICNKIGAWLTGNFLGPIVFNVQNNLAQQVVLGERKWSTRQPLMQLPSALPLAKVA